MDHTIHIYDIDGVLTLCKKRIQIMMPVFGDTVLMCDVCRRINDKASDLAYETTSDRSIAGEELVRSEALSIAVHIYPKKLPLSGEQRYSAEAMVFQFANKCVDYIKNGFPDYDIGFVPNVGHDHLSGTIPQVKLDPDTTPK